MAEILLISADKVRALTTIHDNVEDNYLRPCIYEAQEISLASVLGTTLLGQLKTIVNAGTVDQPENASYKALLLACQYYLAYMTVAGLIPKVSWKVGNFGLVKTGDENLREATAAEIDKAIKDWTDKADMWCKNLQMFVLNHRAEFPELTEGDAHRIHANLYSAASCGVWLGGARGKEIRRACK